MRDSDDLEYALALALNDDGGWYTSAAERADRVQQLATRNVDLHGWHVTPRRTGRAWWSSTATTASR